MKDGKYHISKKIIYIIMILIAIIGCRILYGFNYGLNSNMLVMDNLYRYDIFGNKTVGDVLIEGKYVYYVLMNDKEYSFIKYDYIADRIINEYSFISDNAVYDLKIIKDVGNYYLSSILLNKIYVFDSNLSLLDIKISDDSNKKYGLYKNDIFVIDDNKIYYKNKVYDELSTTCGENEEIIYQDNTYLRFYNYERNLGCLYNMDDKNIYYLDYDSIDISHNNYLEYKTDSLKFRFNDKEYYFTDITENSNLKINDAADYLFTFDSTNNKLRIYNLETEKIIYEKQIDLRENTTISSLKISNYAYFVVLDNNKSYLYIWDYLKDSRVNNSMYSNDEKEYKFKNDRLLQELYEKYQINIYTYDEAVKYFDKIYVIPSYDNILINTKLNELALVLPEVMEDIQDKNISIYFEKNILNGTNNEKILSMTEKEHNNYNIIVNITADNFKDNLLKELNKLKEEKS